MKNAISIGIFYLWALIVIVGTPALPYFAYKVENPQTVLSLGCAMGVFGGALIMKSLAVFNGWSKRRLITCDPAWAIVLLLPPLLFICFSVSDVPVAWYWHVRLYPRRTIDFLVIDGIFIGWMIAIFVGFLKGLGPLLGGGLAAAKTSVSEALSAVNDELRR